MVADLLERSDGRENGPLLGFAVTIAIGLLDQVVEHRLVETDLLYRHRAVIELVDLVGQLCCDFGLGLGAAEEQNAVQRSEGNLAIAGHLRDERRPRSDEAGIREVENGPQVTEPVLDRRAGERESGVRRNTP